MIASNGGGAERVEGLQALERLPRLLVVVQLLEPRALALERRLALVVGRDLADHGRGVGLVRRIEQGLAELAAALEHRAAQRRHRGRAIGVVGREARDPDRAADRSALGARIGRRAGAGHAAPAGRRRDVLERVAHDALDLLLRPEAEQEGAVGRGRGDVGERQHADAGRRGDRADRGHRLVEQRPEDHRGALVDHLLGRLRGRPAACRRYRAAAGSDRSRRRRTAPSAPHRACPGRARRPARTAAAAGRPGALGGSCGSSSALRRLHGRRRLRYPVRSRRLRAGAADRDPDAATPDFTRIDPHRLVAAARRLSVTVGPPPRRTRANLAACRAK